MPEQPNVLVILSDQHRADALGCAGHPVVETPNLDRLADAGVRFRRAYTTSPVCSPARASMLSGLYPHNTGVYDNGAWLSAHERTFFNDLREAGYRTGLVGEASQRFVDGEHLRDHEWYYHDLGFEYVHETTGPWNTLGYDSYMTEEWREKGVYEAFREDYEARSAAGHLDPRYHEASPLGVDDHMDGYVGRRAVEFVEDHDGERPFAAYVGFSSPHGPMDPAGEFAERYGPGDVSEFRPDEEEAPWAGDDARATLDRVAGIDRYHPDLDGFEEAAARYRASYFGKISQVDHWVGRILDALETAGERENTLVVYAADHGEFAGDRRRFGKKTFHEESARVPLIASWPAGLPAGAVTDALVELVDVSATALDAAGAGSEHGTFGRSVLPAARAPDDDARGREAAFGLIDERAMVRTDRYKYAVGPDGAGYRLYDLAEDPGEQRNLIGHPDYGDVERDLRSRFLEFYHRTSARYERVKGGSRYADREEAASDRMRIVREE